MSVHQFRQGGLSACLPAFLCCLLMVAAPVMAQNQRATPPGENPFPGRGPAPSLEGGTAWLNTSGPISLRDLRGKIVLLDFWTYCCINCIHVLPDLKYLEKKYADQLVVIGVHSAKFTNERESENIREAILRYEIEHPVINDSNMIIARKYQFNSWPTLVLIDPEGNFVGRQPGEGTRDLFDMVIGKMVDYHRAKGTLDETPVRFNLEREKEPPRPLHYPGKLLVDQPGNRIFISDSNNNRIVISTLDGELVDVIGNGSIGAQNGSYADASFDHPHGMALVGDTLYVADTENHLIRRVDLKNKRVAKLAGTGVQARQRVSGGTLGQVPLNSPWDLQELKGSLYIAMAGPHQIWKHTLGSPRIELFAGSGREDIIDGPRETAALAQPSGITTDGKDLFFVDSEGSAVRRLEIGRNGTVTTIVGPRDLPNGRSLFEFGDIDGVGEQVRLQHPIGLDYHDGSLFVTDTYNHKIKKVDLESQRCETWLGTGTRGQGLDPVELYEPCDVAVAGTHLLIADTNNHRILKVDLQTKAASEFAVRGLEPPSPPETSPGDEPFLGKVEKLDPVTLASGKPVNVTVNFQLPEEYKLNQLAPVIYTLGSNDEQQLLEADSLNKRRRAEAGETSASITLPLTGTEGTHTFTLTVSYQYCRDGVGGVCKFATKQWEIPLHVSATGVEELQLTTSPE